MTDKHTPDRIWARDTTGWGGLVRGVYQNAPMGSEVGVQYLISTPAREAAPDMLEALQSVLAIDAANYKDYGLLRADIKAALNMAYDAVNKATGEAQ